MSSIRLFITCQYCMICHHNTHKHVTSTRNLKMHFHWYRYQIMPRYYAMILWVSYYFLFWTMWSSYKEPYDMRSFKISTAGDVWFWRYRPSNVMITADFPQVLVFINFLWAVYILTNHHKLNFLSNVKAPLKKMDNRQTKGHPQTKPSYQMYDFYDH